MPLQNIKGSSASLAIINFIFPQIFIEIINLTTKKKKIQLPYHSTIKFFLNKSLLNHRKSEESEE